MLANHVEALGAARRRRGASSAFARAIDCERPRRSRSRARVTVNATGGGRRSLLEPLGLATGMPLLKAMNLVTRRDAGDEALGGRSASGRNLFLVPWRDRALFGTWESTRRVPPRRRSGVTTRDVAAFIGELNQAFPALDLTLDDVTLVHRGVVPAVVADGARRARGPRAGSRPRGRGHRRACSPSPARSTRPPAASPSASPTVLVEARAAGGALPDGDDAAAGRRHRATSALAIADGAARVRRRAAERHDSASRRRATDRATATCWSSPPTRPRLARRVSRDDSPVIGAELVLGRRATRWRSTLADAVIRRTPLGALGYPGDAAPQRAADDRRHGTRLVGRATAQEIARAFYGRDSREFVADT